MGDLTFFLILSGIAIIIAVALFSYYMHHKKIRDEVQGFGHHANQIDDVLLQQTEGQSGNAISDDELPDSFNARHDESVEFDLLKAKPAKSLKKNVQAPLQQKPAQKVPTAQPKVELKAKNQNNTARGQIIKLFKEPIPEGINDLIIAMAIKRVEGNISGKEILTACQACNIQHGEMNIFHFPADDNPSTYALFSIANMLEPGTFDLNNMDNFATSGLSLFMQLPLPMNCLDAYDIFLDKARLLAKFLNAELYDEKFNLVTTQSISHNKEKIKLLQHEILKAKKKEISS